MTCNKCDSCKKGLYKDRPEVYICTGVPEPFEIHDINQRCPEYSEDYWERVSASKKKATKTHFKKLKGMNIDDLTDWLDKHGQFDEGPWLKQFDTKYCQNCEDEVCYYYLDDQKHEAKCSWCELHDNKCKYFPDLNSIPDNKQMIKMWLESPVDADE